VGRVEVVPHLIDDSSPYGVYINCAWLPGGDMLAESYTVEHGPVNQIVAHFEGIYFRKVPLTTLEHGLCLAAGTIPRSLKPERTTLSSAASFPLSRSQHLFEVKPGFSPSKTRGLTASIPSPGIIGNSLDNFYAAELNAPSLTRGINPAAVGTTLEIAHRKSEASPHQSALVKQPSDPGHQYSQSDVKSLIAAVLSLETSDLCEDTDLESLGLDSLASIEAHHALQSHFSILLPSDLFTTHNSVSAIQSFINSRLLADGNSQNGYTCTYSMDTMPFTTDRTELTGCPDTLPISVHRIEQAGKVPLFLIHDGSGLVKYMDNLPSIGRDLWGIYNPNFINGQPWESVESMAAKYAKYTIKAASLGPVLLGGQDSSFF
jgi:acyl carrier protein